MANERGSKFVQITVAEDLDHGGVRLFALDNLGRVWEYEFRRQRWEELQNDRNPLPDGDV